MQKIWQMAFEVIPELVGAIGTTKTGIAENIKKVSESYSNRDPKTSMLRSVRILQKVLSE